jgi:uncharacterized protein
MMSDMARRGQNRDRFVLFILVVAICAPTAAADLRIDLDPPGPREFILDEAGKIDPATQDHLRQACDKLLTDKAVPIIIVTINSMAEHGGAGMRIETFARLLFDQWQVGIAKLGKQSWNTGILVLVSVDDRKARIELGAGWGREKDHICQQIMDERMVPMFKRGDFGGGISAGVEALEAMARAKHLPAVRTAPRPWWHTALVAGVIGLGIFTVVSMIRRGAGGWAWLFWGALFSILGFLLHKLLTSSSSDGFGGGSFGGGFGGGSFGGGSSGGGGATGSW